VKGSFFSVGIQCKLPGQYNIPLRVIHSLSCTIAICCIYAWPDLQRQPPFACSLLLVTRLDQETRFSVLAFGNFFNEYRLKV